MSILFARQSCFLLLKKNDMDFKDLAENLDEWQKALVKRGIRYDLKNALVTYKKHGELTRKVNDLRARQKAAARKRDVTEGTKLKKELAKYEKKLSISEKVISTLAGPIPNIPLEDVPSGGEANNKVLKHVGVVPKIKNPKDHIELGKALDIIDIERGVKISGSRFYFLKNEAVELEFALVRWVFDLLQKKGFEFLLPPELVKREVINAGGYLDQAADEVYKTSRDDLYLIGTAEQSILGYHMDEIIEVPKRYAAFSSCFRREAGSYGKDVRGIFRTHQFDKVEMFSFVAPQDSKKEHEFLVKTEEEILQGLKIPYRKVLVAAGDLGMPAARKIDLESWMPSQNRYREITSCSNCTDWQARRANIRFRKKKSKTEYVHTLNGTAVAIGRTLIAILENYQQSNGAVKIPAVLYKYLSFKDIKPQ